MELIAAEDRCHRLEGRLETLQEIAPSEGQDAETPSIISMLEAADRSSSVPELVRAVGDLELRTRQAMASELVRSASQSRTIEEVAGLLSALRQSGFDAHAQTAPPAMAMVRSVDDTSAPAWELIREGLEEYVLILVQASVKFHQPEDAAAFVVALHRAALPQYAESLLQAMAVTRPLVDLVAVTLTLAGGELDAAVIAAVTSAAQRPVADLVTLTIELRTYCLARYADVLLQVSAATRSAVHVADLIRCLTEHGLEQEAETVFSLAQNRSASHLITLIGALRDDRTWSALEGAAQRRSVNDLAVMIAELYLAGRHQVATNLLMLTLEKRPSAQIQHLIFDLEAMQPGAEAVMAAAARTLTPEDAASLLLRIERCGLPEQAQVIFRSTIYNDLVRQSGSFLAALGLSNSSYARVDVLCNDAREIGVETVAYLPLALESASLTNHVAAIIQVRCHSCPILDVVMLISRLTASNRGPLMERVVTGILDHFVNARSLTEQVSPLAAL